MWTVFSICFMDFSHSEELEIYIKKIMCLTFDWGRGYVG